MENTTPNNQQIPAEPSVMKNGNDTQAPKNQSQNQPAGNSSQSQASAPANNSQNDAVDSANGYGTIGVEEVDMLLMEDEDALDVDNSMYMDATDTADDLEVDFYADSNLASATPTNVDADDYDSALDTVDIFVSEYDAMPDTFDADADYAQQQDAGVSWAGDDPLGNSAEAQDEDGCGCSF